MSTINWNDGPRSGLVEAFTVSLAALIADYEHDGRYNELVADFREGRISLALKRDGLFVLEEAPVPPPTGN